MGEHPLRPPLGDASPATSGVDTAELWLVDLAGNSGLASRGEVLLRHDPVAPTFATSLRPAEATLEALETAVDSWLEEEASREKHRAIARERAQQGRGLLEDYQQLKRQVDELETESAKLSNQFKSWQPAEDKLALCAAEDRLQTPAPGPRED